MTTSLLRTKLYIPLVRLGLVPRPRLTGRLNAGLGRNQNFARKLTLVSAPAGFGKTTLLSEWVSESASQREGESASQREGESANQRVSGAAMRAACCLGLARQRR